MKRGKAKRFKAVALALLLLAPWVGGDGGADPQRRCERLTRGELQSVVEFLSSDELEGRAPGTRGGALAEKFMHAWFQGLGLHSRFQPFTLRGFRLDELRLNAAGRELAFGEEAVGSWTGGGGEFRLEGGAVFAGFGIRAPRWDWDDFKGADLRGKVLLVRVNDPGSFLPGIFMGRALTYYGRWTCKVEEAARAGAAAVLLIHTTPSAGYGWEVVRNSWSGEELYLPSDLEKGPAFRGWVREDALRALLRGRRIDLDSLYRRSLRRDFRPVDLGFTVRLSGRCRSRELQARNVVAEVPGSSGRSVVFSAHIDHLGRDEHREGDGIFNGAIDNGSAAAALALTAKVLSAAAGERRLGLIFLACQAEEAGLLGSKHFAAGADPDAIVATVNFESTPVWERSPDMFAEGAQYSTLEEEARAVASGLGLNYVPFSMPELGLFFRSDQFPFARAGIPAVWLSAGERTASGRNRLGEFFQGGAYHTVGDEFDPGWELEGLRQTVEIAVALAGRLEAARERPRWKGQPPFPIR